MKTRLIPFKIKRYTDPGGAANVEHGVWYSWCMAIILFVSQMDWTYAPFSPTLVSQRKSHCSHFNNCLDFAQKVKMYVVF